MILLLGLLTTFPCFASDVENLHNILQQTPASGVCREEILNLTDFIRTYIQQTQAHAATDKNSIKATSQQLIQCLQSNAKNQPTPLVDTLSQLMIF